MKEIPLQSIIEKTYQASIFIFQKLFPDLPSDTKKDSNFNRLTPGDRFSFSKQTWDPQGKD